MRWCDNENFDRDYSSRKTHGDPVQLFDICLFSMPAVPNCEAPRKKEMETKYTGEWLEKQRTKPICFVSRNQKRPGRHFYYFLETKHAQFPALFPMFPFSCVSTSTVDPTRNCLYPKFSMILREVLRKKFRHRQVERAVQISPSSVLGNRRSGRGSRSSKQCKHAIFCFTFMHAKKAYELMRGEWPFRLSGVRQF